MPAQLTHTYSTLNELLTMKIVSNISHDGICLAMTNTSLCMNSNQVKGVHEVAVTYMYTLHTTHNHYCRFLHVEAAHSNLNATNAALCIKSMHGCALTLSAYAFLAVILQCDGAFPLTSLSPHSTVEWLVLCTAVYVVGSFRAYKFTCFLALEFL